MANVGTVTFDVAAESAKLRSELEKVKKDVGGIAATAKNFESGLKKIGGVLVGAFSIGAISAFASKINQAGDRLNDLSQKLGVSASRLNVIELAATQAGASTEAVSTAMAKLTENVGAAAMGSKAQAEAIATLGLSTAELVKLRPDQVFEAVTQALSRMPNEFQRAAVAQDLFGKGAKELSQFFREGADAIGQATAFLEKHNAVLSDLDVARIGVMNDLLGAQGIVVENLGMKFLSNFSPAVGVAVEQFSRLIEGAGGATEAGRTMGIVFVAVVKAVETAASIIAAVFESIRSVVATVIGVVLKGLEKLVGGFAFVAEKLGLDIAENLRATQEGISGIAESMLSIANSAAVNAKSAAANAFQAAKDVLNSAEIFDQASRRLEERAKAAAARAPGGGAIATVGGGGEASRILADTPLSAGGAAGNVRVEGPGDAEWERMLQEQQDRVTESLRAAGVLRVQEWSASLDQMTGLSQLAADQQIVIEQAKSGMMSNVTASLVSATIAGTGKMAKVQKGIAIASTIWNTGRAVMKAWAEVPWPANIAAAAAVAVLGLRQIQTIKSTNYSPSGSVSGSLSLGGGGGAGGAGEQGGFTPPAALTQQEPRRQAQIIIHGNVFSSQETAQYLLDVLSEAINDRDVVVISGDSRQALELGVG